MRRYRAGVEDVATMMVLLTAHDPEELQAAANRAEPAVIVAVARVAQQRARWRPTPEEREAEASLLIERYLFRG